ncbi:MAG: hypothetical protein JOZ69_12830 [Myxococcales bacterium]|nr:hypothetical protein [Myxococcales bacterium]
MDLRSERAHDLEALERMLGRAGLSIWNPIRGGIGMFTDGGDHEPCEREELEARWRSKRTWGLLWWTSEGIDFFCTIASLDRGYSLTFYFDGVIEYAIQEVCDALFSFLRERVPERTVPAVCVDFDDVVPKDLARPLRFVGDSGELPDIVGAPIEIPLPNARVSEIRRVDGFRLLVLCERARPWARTFTEVASGEP